MALADAKLTITDANCTVGRTFRRFNAVVPKGQVIRTAPKAGSVRPNGTKVAIFVSKGKKK